MAKKAEKNVSTPEHESEEWVRVDSNGNPLADQAPSAEEIEAQMAAANRAHTESLGDAWAVLTGQNPASIMGQMTLGFPLSPLTGATFLLLGLSGQDLGDHQKHTLPYAWAASAIMVAVGCVACGLLF